MKPADLVSSLNCKPVEQTSRAVARGANRQMAVRHSSSPKNVLPKKAPDDQKRHPVITERRFSIASVELEIARLGDHTREELIQRWSGTYGRQPPKGISRRLLELSAAYAIQSAAFGGLKPQMRKILAASLEPNSASSSSKMKSAPLTAGSQLIRNWNGRIHHVEVVDDVFIWNGERFRSLSAIAYKITGVRWSGPRFFGL